MVALRGILGVLGGGFVAFLTIVALQVVSFLVFALPAGVSMSDPKTMEEYMKSVPVGALLFVLLGYFVGMLFGTWIAGKISPRTVYVSAAILCVFFLIGNYFNLADESIVHPPWFAVVSYAVFPLGAALGAFASRAPGAKPARSAPDIAK